jgi:hypothetical protein
LNKTGQTVLVKPENMKEKSRTHERKMQETCDEQVMNKR